MNNLFAIPFDTYTSGKTDQGVIYNVCDANKVVQVQCAVSHVPYANHDLTIENISGAPSNVRVKLVEILNDKYGVDQWKVITRFSKESTRTFHGLNVSRFADNTKKIIYNDQAKKTFVDNAQLTAIQGLIY